MLTAKHLNNLEMRLDLVFGLENETRRIISMKRHKEVCNIWI